MVGITVATLLETVLTIFIAIQSFKAFLDSISALQSDDTGKNAILKDYLEAQKPADEDDKEAVYLSDVMQTWSFASQSNDDSLLSAVPAVLALLLRTISNLFELSEYGLRLGRTLLQKRQQELMSRGLASNKSKEFLISPVLRLLRELTSFDGGLLAKQVFRARDFTFKNLARNLNLRYTGNGVEDRKKPSVRTNAIRLVLSAIKFLPVESKRELLNQKDIVGALTRDIKDDPPFMVRDILETLKSSVVQDEALPRDAKTRIVNAMSLGRIATLYRYTQPDEEPSTAKKPVDTIAHEFLLLACTSPDLGVLNRQTGFYPRGIDPDDTNDANVQQEFIDLGLDSVEWMNRFKEKVPIRNTILSEFIQNLRPWSSTKQSDLLLAIFKSAPELVAEYFYAKKGFTFDPKLTATWIGYSAFLFSALQLPVPKYLGHHEHYARLPPPTSIVLESILPQPLNQKVLSRCLNQPDKLITFFAVRILCVAFMKLREILDMYREASAGSLVWTQAAERLTDEFCQRSPSIKDVINAFRSISITDLMQREAITRLLVLYFEVVPRIALDAKFDVSATLAETLTTNDETPEDQAMRAMELENLFQFANFSPGMRWFAKAEGLTISPFMAMLKISAEAPTGLPLVKLRLVLDSVIKENQIFQSQTPVSSLDTFILTLRSLRDAKNGAQVYEFLDDCISRCAGKPIKYIFSLEEIHGQAHSGKKKESRTQQPLVSLLTMTIVEQWPFVVKSATQSVLQDIAQFTAQFLAASIKIGEDKKAIKLLITQLASETPESSMARKSIDESRTLVNTVAVPQIGASTSAPEEQSIESNTISKAQKKEITSKMLEDSAPPQDYSVLNKWTTKEVDEVIEGGFASALIMLLSSEHLSFRKEAATTILKFAAKLKESTFEEKEQIWLLLCEVAETARKVIDQEPLPTIIAAFASNAIAVLNDPLHCLYPKINTFLSQGPTWDLDKVPLMYKILDESPSLDDSHYLETDWLLNYMLHGLRTTADLAIFRKRRVFEKLFSLYSNVYLGQNLREKILKILFRATNIEGGSTTLVTRSSSMTWLQAQVALEGGLPLKVLMKRILESCDQKRVSTWSKQGVQKTVVDTLSLYI
jgi:nucleolar pre-ribosomal-associated protein 1